ncbi:helix-turn-helix domain-containing protein [Polymorphospora rubra]|uniref:winged helix-turn-helix transcriptional regulator n=1 Tax=Polymorphospora rubra TaxID=338584 RepID=UPI0031DCF141
MLRRVSDKWTLLLITLLGRQPYRFNELHRAVEGISQRMLTRTLRVLESDGLVEREVFPTSPPSVEYRLTPLGASLLEPLSALASWAVDHHAEIAASRTGTGCPGPAGRSPAGFPPSPLDRPGRGSFERRTDEPSN